MLNKGDIKKLLGTVALIQSSLVLIELITYVGSKDTDIFIRYNNERYAYLIACSLSYILYLLLGKLKNLNKTIKMPVLYCVNIIVIPLSVVAIIMILLKYASIDKKYLGLVVVLLICINTVGIYIYDIMYKTIEDELEKSALSQERDSYKKELEYKRESVQVVSSCKHDMRNHLLAIWGIIEENDIDEVKLYISKLLKIVEGKKIYSKSGNITIDSIVNYKCAYLEELGVNIYTDIRVPKKVKISSEVLVSVIGNLMDNAIFGVSTISDDRYTSLKIIYERNILTINIANRYDGVVIEKNGVLISRKKDISNHGIGLGTLKIIAKNCGGLLECTYNEYIEG
ncbi:MAG: GHKL domain-containing protein [Clostridioides sp.]|nr:GHKL domain-containing protein [Clostridioides sp.]